MACAEWKGIRPGIVHGKSPSCNRRRGKQIEIGDGSVTGDYGLGSVAMK